jgi:hypothetical protein
MTFTIQKLTGSRAVVSGTDVAGTEGKLVVSTHQWDELNARTETDQAQAAFDTAVEAFFKPLTDAAEELATKVQRPTDSIGYVVLSEPEEGRPAKPGQLVKLTHDSIVLRIIESGNTDRLLWVGDNLEILEAPATPSTSGNGVTAAAPVPGEDDAQG